MGLMVADGRQLRTRAGGAAGGWGPSSRERAGARLKATTSRAKGAERGWGVMVDRNGPKGREGGESGLLWVFLLF